jgi:predicted permease
MIEILTAIATIFALILLGSWLRIKSVPSEEYWLYADKLVYWILFPSFLFYKTSTIDIDLDVMRPMAQTLVLGLVIAVMFSWLTSRWLNINEKACSSIVQAAGRHNTFIALAIAESLFGERGLEIATLSTALLVPFTNIVIVVALVIILNKGQDQLWKKISGDLVRNPLLIAIAIGFLANALGLNRVPVVHDVAALLSSATLPVVLLCIGASLRLQHMKNTVRALTLSMFGKMLVFPLVVLVIAHLTSLPAEITIILLIYSAVPTAASGFALARQMGGDYRLMATLITNQTLISFFTLPLTIYLGAKWLGIAL